MSKRWVILIGLLSSMIVLVAGCGDPPTKIGDVCQIDEHCGGKEGSFELKCDASIPGGSCVYEGCTPELKPPDEDTLDVPEDEGTCPSGSRCVLECNKDDEECPEDRNREVCRRSCDQQSDCGEVIVCKWNYDKVDACIVDCTEDETICIDECAGDSTCVDNCGATRTTCELSCEDKRFEECKNEMECKPVWPEPIPDWVDDPPRACILRDRLFTCKTEMDCGDDRICVKGECQNP